MVLASQNSFMEVLRGRLNQAKSLFPHKAAAAVVKTGAAFDTPEAAPVRSPAPPLPPCKPFNQAEAREAATLAALRGALYPTES